MQAINTSDTEPSVDSQRKITLGFKCLPSLKSALSQEAEAEGLTLSSYVEILINEIPEKNNQINQLSEENRNIKSRIDLLLKRVAVYENDYLKDLYKKHLNQTVTYINTKDESIKKEILILPDVYEIIINSFKYTDK